MDDDFDFNETYNNNNNDPSTSSRSSPSRLQCLNCGSSSFYRDSVTDNLVCNECYTQSQSQSQRETNDYEEMLTVAAVAGGSRFYGRRNEYRSTKKKPHELDESRPLPSVVECCSAFQTLLKLAAERVAVIASPLPVPVSVPAHMSVPTTGANNSDSDNNNNNSQEEIEEQKKKQEKFQTILLENVKQIWFQYLQSWNKAATFYSDLFPELRISFRDYFLTNSVRTMLMRYLSAKAIKNVNEKMSKVKKEDVGSWNATIKSEFMDMDFDEKPLSDPKLLNPDGNSASTRKRKRRIKWEDEEDNTNIGTDRSDNYSDSDSDYNDDGILLSSLRKRKNLSENSEEDEADETSNDTNHDYKEGASYRAPAHNINTMLNQVEGRIDDTTIHPHYAILKLKPSLNLLSSIIYLALLQCNIGISSHHLVSWSLNGMYPFLLNGLKQLPESIQNVLKKCSCTRPFRQRVLPKPALLDYYADLLIISLGLDSHKDGYTRMERMNKRVRNSYTNRQMKNFPYISKANLPKYLAPPIIINDEETQTHQKQEEIGGHGKKGNDNTTTSAIPTLYQESQESSQEYSQEYSQDLLPQIGMRKNDASTTEISTQLSPNTLSPNEVCSQDIKRDEDQPSSSSLSLPPLIIKYYQDNIPLMAYRFVTDLGLCQRVLDITLALVGFDVSPSNEQQQDHSHKGRFDAKSFIPAPLNNASADKIASPVHLMAVIVVACKMCHGWENWEVHLSPQVVFGKSICSPKTKKSYGEINKNETTKLENQDDTVIKDDDSDLILLGHNRMKKKKKISNSVRQRFIPWTDDDVHLMRNGTMLNDYFDFVEETYGDEMSTPGRYDDVLSMVTSSLKNIRKKRVIKDEVKYEEGQVQTQVQVQNEQCPIEANTLIAGAVNPNMPTQIKQKDRNFYHFLRLRNKGAVWADANGFGEYIIYKDMHQHAVSKRQIGGRELSTEPFHPHYGLLIEYISDKFHVEPGELHYLVSCLDGEISHYHRPEQDWSLKRNSRTSGLGKLLY